MKFPGTQCAEQHCINEPTVKNIDYHPNGAKTTEYSCKEHGPRYGGERLNPIIQQDILAEIMKARGVR